MVHMGVVSQLLWYLLGGLWGLSKWVDSRDNWGGRGGGGPKIGGTFLVHIMGIVIFWGLH